MFVQVVSSKTMWGQPPSAVRVAQRRPARVQRTLLSVAFDVVFDFDFDVVNEPHEPLSFRTGRKPGGETCSPILTPQHLPTVILTFSTGCPTSRFLCEKWDCAQSLSSPKKCKRPRNLRGRSREPVVGTPSRYQVDYRPGVHSKSSYCKESRTPSASSPLVPERHSFTRKEWTRRDSNPHLIP
jgi:hypothetical protein